MKLNMKLSKTVDVVILIAIVGSLVCIAYLFGYARGGEDLYQQVEMMCYTLKYILV